MKLLLDTANLYARNKYKLGYLTTSNGRPSGALFGLIRSVDALTKRYQPDQVIFALEGGGSAARKLLLPTYKAQRPTDRPFYDEGHREALIEWIGLAGYTTAWAADGEADDVIAALVSEPSVIASTDRDFRQLLADEIILVADAAKDPYRIDDLFRDWGCHPEQYWMLRALSGDSSDNIPGIPRVGDKTAAKIAQTHEWDWAKILTDPKVAPWREQVALAATVIHFRPLTDIVVAASAGNPEQLQAFYQRWEFSSLMDQ